MQQKSATVYYNELILIFFPGNCAITDMQQKKRHRVPIHKLILILFFGNCTITVMQQLMYLRSQSNRLFKIKDHCVVKWCRSIPYTRQDQLRRIRSQWKQKRARRIGFFTDMQWAERIPPLSSVLKWHKHTSYHIHPQSGPSALVCINWWLRVPHWFWLYHTPITWPTSIIHTVHTLYTNSLSSLLAP
jgi:hypothetical protein